MPLISILLLYCLGITVIFLISPKFNLLERIGLAFPVGTGAMSLIVFIISGIGIKLTRTSILAALLIVISVLSLFILNKAKSIKKVFDFSSWKADIVKLTKNIQIAWIVGAALVLYILYAITAKSLYWPTIHYDSVAGYDFLAKAIAHEGTINNSPFRTQQIKFVPSVLYIPHCSL